jgi:lysophospholipase L1-like esterase
MTTCFWLAAALVLTDAPPPLRIVILGDSTVCDYPAGSPLRGWGQMLPARFDDGVTVVNLAASGRSAKTFIREGRLKRACAVTADYALIQFGHNDSHGPGHPEATDAATDFRDYLRQDIDELAAAGAKAILVTPMHRRLFQDGRPTTELQPYADAMAAVAGERHVPLVDLHKRSGELLAKLGEADSGDLFGPGDRTHFSPKGATAMAELVADELRSACPELAARLKGKE